MAKYAVPSINLAKNRGEHLTERVLAFALTIGRTLVIVTEAIALGAFLFRFGLDEQLVNLHDHITQEQAIVNLLKSNEASFRNLQDRLTLEKTITTVSSQNLTVYQDIFKMVPSDMLVTGISFSGTSVQINGSLSSLVALSAFVNKLKTYTSIDHVSLDKLENKTTEGNIDVTITAFLKQSKNNQLL